MSLHNDLHKFLRDPTRRGRKCQIGGYPFYINPDTIGDNKERQHIEVVTLAGNGSIRYPIKPVIWTMQGHTGIKGADELDKMERELNPETNPEALHSFQFPPLFLHTLYVLVNKFNKSSNNQRHMYVMYDIELVVRPRQTFNSYARLASSNQIYSTLSGPRRGF